MTREHDAHVIPEGQTIYQIRLGGGLGLEWSGWFEGLTVAPQDNGDTILTGPVVDQAALHGLLKQVRDLGLPLLSVTHITAGRPDAVAHWKEARP